MTMAGVIAGDMGELRPARGVAHGEDPAVGGAQPPIDDEAASGIGGDAGLVEIEALEVGAAAGGHQQMRALDAPLARSVLEHDGDAPRRAFDPADLWLPPR